jgi:hypothetical protein
MERIEGPLIETGGAIWVRCVPMADNEQAASEQASSERSAPSSSTRTAKQKATRPATPDNKASSADNGDRGRSRRRSPTPRSSREDEF